MCRFEIGIEDRNIIILSLGLTEADEFIKKTMFDHFTLAKGIIVNRNKALWATTVTRKIKHPKLSCRVFAHARATRSNSDLDADAFIMREVTLKLKNFRYDALSFTLNDYLNYEFETHILRS